MPVYLQIPHRSVLCNGLQRHDASSRPGPGCTAERALIGQDAHARALCFAGHSSE